MPGTDGACQGHRRGRRGGPARDGVGQGRGRCQGERTGQSTRLGRTTSRALVALGTYVAQDLRDPDGVTRPLLRRAALRMSISRREPVRRLGGAYLRTDSPVLEQLDAPAGAPAPLLLSPPELGRSSAQELQAAAGGESAPV
jgi:hypothetical protein